MGLVINLQFCHTRCDFYVCICVCIHIQKEKKLMPLVAVFFFLEELQIS